MAQGRKAMMIEGGYLSGIGRRARWLPSVSGAVVAAAVLGLAFATTAWAKKPGLDLGVVVESTGSLLAGVNETFAGGSKGDAHPAQAIQFVPGGLSGVAESPSTVHNYAAASFLGTLELDGFDALFIFSPTANGPFSPAPSQNVEGDISGPHTCLNAPNGVAFDANFQSVVFGGPWQPLVDDTGQIYVANSGIDPISPFTMDASCEENAAFPTNANLAIYDSTALFDTPPNTLILGTGFLAPGIPIVEPIGLYVDEADISGCRCNATGDYRKTKCAASSSLDGLAVCNEQVVETSAGLEIVPADNYNDVVYTRTRRLWEVDQALGLVQIFTPDLSKALGFCYGWYPTVCKAPAFGGIFETLAGGGDLTIPNYIAVNDGISFGTAYITDTILGKESKTVPQGLGRVKIFDFFTANPYPNSYPSSFPICVQYLAATDTDGNPYHYCNAATKTGYVLGDFFGSIEGKKTKLDIPLGIASFSELFGAPSFLIPEGVQSTSSASAELIGDAVFVANTQANSVEEFGTTGLISGPNNVKPYSKVQGRHTLMNQPTGLGLSYVY
jgi:hypothetical protein